MGLYNGGGGGDHLLLAGEEIECGGAAALGDDHSVKALSYATFHLISGASDSTVNRVLGQG